MMRSRLLSDAVIDGEQFTEAVSCRYLSAISFQAIAALPEVATFDTGHVEVQTLTFPAFADIDAQDFVIITDPAGLTWAVYADKSGTDIAPSAAAYVAVNASRKSKVDLSTAIVTAAQVAAAFEVAFDTLTGFTSAITSDDSAADGTMTMTGVAFGPMVDPVLSDEDGGTAGTILGVQTTGGVASDYDLAANTITIPDHGFSLGTKVTLTSAGAPTGLSNATAYYVIVDDENTIRLAATLADALADNEVNITAEGTPDATHTLTPNVASSSSIQIQVTNDNLENANWVAIGSAVNVTGAGSVLVEDSDVDYRWARLKIAAGDGVYAMDVIACGREIDVA